MTIIGFADRVALLPLGDNRPGDLMSSFKAVTIHETANENAGATAAMHLKYWSPGGGGRTVSSIHYVVDELESIQLIPTNEQAWHAGDAVGNTTSVGIEICVNSRAGYPVACRKTARITAQLLKDHGLSPVDGVTVRKHGSWPGTTHRNCPQHLNAGDWGVTWLQFFSMVQLEYGALSTTNYAQLWGTAYPYFEASGVAQEWRRAALTLGAATSDEHSTSDGLVWRHFTGGAISYDPKTGRLRSYFPRP